MTINKMHKRLAWLKQRGFGNRSVVINKRTFSHPLEGDGCCMLNVVDFKMGSYNILDDDGCCIENKDGSERLGFSLVLMGEKIKKQERENLKHATNQRGVHGVPAILPNARNNRFLNRALPPLAWRSMQYVIGANQRNARKRSEERKDENTNSL